GGPARRWWFPATSRLRSAAADALWYPRLRVDGVDLLHCPTFRGPFAAKVPLVVTVHDLGVLREPSWFNRWTRTYSRFAVPRVVRAAARLIAVSEFTKRELIELLGVAEGRIRVVPNAVADVFTPDGARAEGDYVLAVGTLEPRKNLARVAAAVDGELRVVGARGRAARRRRAGGGWRRPAARGHVPGRGERRGARSPLPRRALPRLRLAVRGLRPARRRGDRLRLSCGDERRQRDGRVRRRRR